MALASAFRASPALVASASIVKEIPKRAAAISKASRYGVPSGISGSLIASAPVFAAATPAEVLWLRDFSKNTLKITQ